MTNARMAPFAPLVMLEFPNWAGCGASCRCRLLLPISALCEPLLVLPSLHRHIILDTDPLTFLMLRAPIVSYDNHVWRNMLLSQW